MAKGKPVPTEFKFYIFSAKVQDGEWAMTIKIPAVFGPQAAAMTLQEGVVWNASVLPEKGESYGQGI